MIAGTRTGALSVLLLAIACGGGESTGGEAAPGGQGGGGAPGTGGGGGADPTGTGRGGEGAGEPDGGGVFKSLTRFAGSSEVRELPWASGMGVTVDSVNGSVEVIDGPASDRIAVRFTPFVFRAHDTGAEEVETDLMLLEMQVLEGPSGVTVDASRQEGAPPTLGVDITVELPLSFNGALELTQNNGTVDVRTSTSPSSVIIVSDIGSIDVAVGVMDAVDILGDTGGISVSMGAIAPFASGGSIIAQGPGGISLAMPSDGAFSVLATAADTVDFGVLPAACMEQVAAENSKTLTCNGGGTNFRVDVAGFTGDVVVGYR